MLPVGVVHDHDDFEPTKSYRTCDFIVSQYRWEQDQRRCQGVPRRRAGAGPTGWPRDRVQSEHPARGSPGHQCPKYGDDSPSGMLCPMTPDQIREWGTVLGSAGCALTMWRYEPEYFNRSDIQRAIQGTLRNRWPVCPQALLAVLNRRTGSIPIRDAAARRQLFGADEANSKKHTTYRASEHLLRARRQQLQRFLTCKHRRDRHRHEQAVPADQRLDLPNPPSGTADSAR